MARPKGVTSYKTSKAKEATGHQLADIQLTDSFDCRRVVCRCGWLSGWWSTPELAAEEWRIHAGVSE